MLKLYVTSNSGAMRQRKRIEETKRYVLHEMEMEMEDGGNDEYNWWHLFVHGEGIFQRQNGVGHVRNLLFFFSR